jgi:hypothetical protein
MRLGSLGDSAACGSNPCSAWDMSAGVMFPFLGLMSSECQSYLVCSATGASVTPDPSQIPSLNTGGNDTGSGGGGGGVQDLQLACTRAGNTWNPLTSTCTPAFMTYVPWIVAGIAALILLPPLLERR